MFTDMVGYTALGQRNEALSLALLEEQRKLVRPILARHEGREVKTIGDAFLVEFPSALEAVRCAYDIQRATREFNFSLPEDRRIHLRIGVHLGDVVGSGDDISGDAVNVASRIEPLAEDGGVCITRQVHDHVQDKIEVSMVSIGSKVLKNVSTPMEVYKMVMPWGEEKPTQTSRDRKRIAVLPLSNISHDSSDEYFADGMTEELINALSHVDGLKVIARTSVLRYRGNPKSVAEIGKELGVGSVIEGSVRKAGDRVRVTAQLIDVATEEHLWSENYDRRVEDIFAIQSDVAGTVADVLKTKLLDGERRKLETGSTINPEAYDRYLLGKHSRPSHPPERVRFFEEAIRLDPNFALAYATLANLYVQLSGDFIPFKTAFSKASEYIDKALQLDDQLSSAWVAKGNLAYQFEWDAQKAEQSFNRAIELNPNNSHAYAWYAALCLSTSRYDRALEFALKGRSLDPYPPAPPEILGLSYGMMRKLDDALRECARLVELYPDDLMTHSTCAIIHGLLGMPGEAVKELDRLRLKMNALLDQGAKGWTAGVWPGFYSLNSLSYAAAGKTEVVRAMIADALEAAKSEYVSPGTLGTLYLAAGEREDAFRQFELGLEERDSSLFMYMTTRVRLMNQVSELSGVTSDPRFKSLVQRIGVGLG
jgi:adenylate cyclase